MFKGIGGIGSLLRQAGQISSKMEGTERRTPQPAEPPGRRAAAWWRVEVNGLVEVLRCRIDPALVAQGDAEMLEDLVVGATNQAIGKGQADSCGIASNR